MAKSVYDINMERKKANKTLKNTFDMFPVGTKVKVICVAQDFYFFCGDETGEVIKNSGKYLGIIVKFDKPRHFKGGHIQESFNFGPDDLLVIEESPKRVCQCCGREFS